MIGAAASGMVQGVQSEMDMRITMMIKVGSRGMINTGNHEGCGDGRGRGPWTQGMAEMKSDVEWDEILWESFCHPRYPLASLIVWSTLIKPGLALECWSSSDGPFNGLAPLLGACQILIIANRSA